MVLSNAYRIFALLLLSARAFAGVHEVWWDITYVENANPDGLFPRRVIGINNTWPPPPLDVKSTDSLVVHAFNSLDEPTTLHHHGMFLNSTSWMDGAAGVSQCGIPPGQEFTYVIPIDTSGQWGSYWVHAHDNGAYVDGLRAPLLIHPPTEVYSYDEEFTVILGDWYHQEHSVLIKQYISVNNPDGVEPIPDSGLMYFAHDGTYLGPKRGSSPSGSTAAVGFNENATLPFEPGKTYRLRIINTSAFAAFFFWIDGHNMTIIEVDGTDIEKYPMDLISVTVAQRYSVLVTARDDTSANWAIHANMDTTMFDVVPSTLNPNVTSSITYNCSASLAPSPTVNAYYSVNDTQLVPVIPETLPSPGRTIDIEWMFETFDDGKNYAIVNGFSYHSPLVPAILSELTLGPNATVARAYGPLSFVLDHNEVIDVVLKNGDNGGHPFHLHGHKFLIVGRSLNYTLNDPSENVPINKANPMRRDTIQIPAGQSATIRFVADNPGAWFLHCHIEWHLEVGLAVQMIEAPLIAQERDSYLPPAVAEQCKMLGNPTSGNAAGHASITDLSGWYLGPFPPKASGS